MNQKWIRLLLFSFFGLNAFANVEGLITKLLMLVATIVILTLVWRNSSDG